MVLLLVAPDGFRATAHGTRVAWKWRRLEKRQGEAVNTFLRKNGCPIRASFTEPGPSEPGLPADSCSQEPRGHAVCENGVSRRGLGLHGP